MIQPEKTLVRNKIFGFLIASISVLLLTSCNDSPTDLGSDLLNQDDVQVLKFNSAVDSMYQSSSTFKTNVPLTSADWILLGNAENVTSHIMLKFVFASPDSLQKDLIDNKINILDSWIEFYNTYSFGEQNSPFDYEAYKINQEWTSLAFNADSFSTLKYDPSDLSSLHNVQNDTIYSFHLNPSVAGEWLLSNADTNLATNNGLLISPKSNTKKILGFQAYNINATKDPRLKVVIEKPGVYQDTLTGYVASDLSVVIGNLADVGAENISVQSSLAAESKIFFDMKSFPVNSTINSATLTLTLDTVQTKTGSSFTNSVRVYLLKDSTKNEINTNYVYTLNRIGNTFTGSITNIIRAINNGVANQGFLIKSGNELSGVDIFAIKGSNAADKSERPKLEIVYSRKK